MDSEALHIRYLIGAAAILCALIIGYNLFFVSDASMTTVVYADSSSSSQGKRVSGSEGYAPSRGTTSSQSTQSTASKSINGKININTATEQELSAGLPGVGDVMAKRIVEYRQKNGSFKTIEDIKKVSGIGEKTFEKLRGYITAS